MTRRVRPILLNAMQRAMVRSSRLPIDDQLKLTAGMTAALQALQFGKHDGTECRQLADALNTAEALCDMGIGSDIGSRCTVAAGLQALANLYTRHAINGSWTLKSTELGALTNAVWTHSMQIGLCSMGEFERAMKKVENVCRGARAGNAGPNVTMVGATA